MREGRFTLMHLQVGGLEVDEMDDVVSLFDLAAES